MKYFKTLLTALVMLSPLATEAANYLTVTDADGSKTSFVLTQKPVVSFTTSSLRLVAGNDTIDYPLSQYRSFALTDDNETTAVNTIKAATSGHVFTLGETLQAKGLEPYSTVAIYTISGQQVRQAKAGADGAVSIPLNGLKGVMVVKTSTKSFKFIKR
jgi:hypothetical protein